MVYIHIYIYSLRYLSLNPLTATQQKMAVLDNYRLQFLLHTSHDRMQRPHNLLAWADLGFRVSPHHFSGCYEASIQSSRHSLVKDTVAVKELVLRHRHEFVYIYVYNNMVSQYNKLN